MDRQQIIFINLCVMALVFALVTLIMNILTFKNIHSIYDNEPLITVTKPANTIYNYTDLIDLDITDNSIFKNVNQAINDGYKNILVSIDITEDSIQYVSSEPCTIVVWIDKTVTWTLKKVSNLTNCNLIIKSYDSSSKLVYDLDKAQLNSSEGLFTLTENYSLTFENLSIYNNTNVTITNSHLGNLAANQYFYGITMYLSNSSYNFIGNNSNTTGKTIILRDVTLVGGGYNCHHCINVYSSDQLEIINLKIDEIFSTSENIIVTSGTSTKLYGFDIKGLKITNMLTYSTRTVTKDRYFKISISSLADLYNVSGGENLYISFNSGSVNSKIKNSIIGTLTATASNLYLDISSCIILTYSKIPSWSNVSNTYFPSTDATDSVIVEENVTFMNCSITGLIYEDTVEDNIKYLSPYQTIVPTLSSYFTGTGNTGASEQGRGLAISADGTTLVIGGDNDNSNVGAIWIFVGSGTSWTQQGSKLVPTGTTGTPHIGDTRTLSISDDGNTVVVGGPSDNTFKGGVWVFVRSGTTWSQQGAKLLPSDYTGSPRFGYCTDISSDGDQFVAGGWGNASNVGAVWVYTRSGTTWTQQARIIPDDNVGSSRFGRHLSLKGTTLAVGGYTDNSSAGAVWIYTGSGATWTKVTKITPTDLYPYDFDTFFGGWVTLSPDATRLFVNLEAYLNYNGAVEYYKLVNGTWTRIKRRVVLSDLDVTLSSTIDFGIAMVATSDRLFVCGPTYNSNVGKLFVYNINFVPIYEISPINDILLFGYDIAATSDTVLIGAPGKGTSVGAFRTITGF